MRQTDQSNSQKEERFDKILEAFDGTLAEVTLREMMDEFDGNKERCFDLVQLTINRIDQIAQLWKEITDP